MLLPIIGDEGGDFKNQQHNFKTRCSLYIDIVQVQILTQFTDVDHPLVHKPGDRKSLVDYSIFKWGN